ncbi:DUF3540 domain-containing protein [Rhodoferax sp.]|uniref:DUF3540 domain-containing protein n=1 Tax=Rhodoferax sp. TaxID=50421 RepID=UPI0027445B47|nr:DUF3540 domain-containing protein [Rhodoferax sp.]
MSSTVKSTKRHVHKPSPAARPSQAHTSGTPADWCVGIVTEVEDRQFLVTSGNLRARATRAASCLLEPSNGDSVACLRVAPDEVWILAVLQREACAEQVLRCHGNTRWAVEGGALTLDAPELRIRGDCLEVSVQRTKLTTDIAEVVGRQFRLIATSVKVIGGVLSTVMDRVNHFSKNYLRTTDGTDRVSAIHIECEAKQLLRMEAEHTLVNGSKLIKARASQIHFG